MTDEAIINLLERLHDGQKALTLRVSSIQDALKNSVRTGIDAPDSTPLKYRGSDHEIVERLCIERYYSFELLFVEKSMKIEHITARRTIIEHLVNIPWRKSRICRATNLKASTIHYMIHPRNEGNPTTKDALPNTLS